MLNDTVKRLGLSRHTVMQVYLTVMQTVEGEIF